MDKSDKEKRQNERAAVRRLLMYWGNAERTRTDKERQLVTVDEEIESQYDLHPQRLTGMPHGSGVSDATYNAALKAAREIKRLERKKTTHRNRAARAELSRGHDRVRGDVSAAAGVRGDKA